MARFAHAHACGKLRDVQEARWAAFVSSASKAHANAVMRSRDALVRGGPHLLAAHELKCRRMKNALDARMVRLDEEFFGRRDYATEIQFKQAAG